MGIERFALEALEHGMEHLRLSEELLKPLWKIAAKFEVFECKSPWKDRITRIAKNVNKVTIEQAGAKSVESKTGEILVHRQFRGYGPDLPDGSPTLRFTLFRPSGNTTLYVKPNTNGTFSPVRL